MPEGDSIARAAARLAQWIGGRTVTAARSQRARVPAGALVGQTVRAVEANGKHLLIRFESGRTLHTHMRMTGSWHVYRTGERWRKPAHLARIVLECDDHVAVCFNAPVVELLDIRSELVHAALSRLGPDVMRDDFDLDEVRRRVRAQPPDRAIGDLLLDQSIAAGIGNIYRCESLFRTRLDPFALIDGLPQDRVDEVFQAARELMRSHSSVRSRPWVYGRAGRPCRRCGTRVRSAPLGEPPRTLYWCPRCQAPDVTDVARAD